MPSTYLRKNALVYDEDWLSHQKEAVNRLSDRAMAVDTAASLSALSFADIANKFAATSEAMKKLTKAMEKEKGAKTASALLESSRFTATDLYSSNSAPQPKQTAPSKKESKPLTTSPFGEW